MASSPEPPFLQPLIDEFRCSLIDFSFKLELFRDVFNSKCSCGEIAITCDIHSEGVLGLLEDITVSNEGCEPPTNTTATTFLKSESE